MRAGMRITASPAGMPVGVARDLERPAFGVRFGVRLPSLENELELLHIHPHGGAFVVPGVGVDADEL
jgi:hypothetical protein